MHISAAKFHLQRYGVLENFVFKFIFPKNTTSTNVWAEGTVLMLFTHGLNDFLVGPAAKYLKPYCFSTKHPVMRKIFLIFALAALVLSACEKEDTQKTDDGLVFCPLNWVYQRVNGNCHGGFELDGYKVRDSSLHLKDVLKDFAYTIFTQGKQNGNGQASLFLAKGEFEAVVDIEPVTVSEGSMFDFRLEQMQDSVFTSMPFLGLWRAEHSIALVKTGEGYDLHFIGAQDAVVAAGLKTLGKATMSLRRKHLEGGNHIVLHAKLFGTDGQLLLEKEASEPERGTLWLPEIKIQQGWDYMRQEMCSDMYWRVLRYGYKGEGRGVSDDFSCNTVYNLPQ